MSSFRWKVSVAPDPVRPTAPPHTETATPSTTPLSISQAAETQTIYTFSTETYTPPSAPTPSHNGPTFPLPDLPPGRKLSSSEFVALTLDFVSELGRYGDKWTLNDLLYYLFKESTRRDKMVTALLNGSSFKTRPFTAILDAMRERARIVNYRTNDETAAPHGEAYIPGKHSSSYEHAYPAMTSWSVELVCGEVRAESDAMISEKAGLHVRATQKSKRKGAKKKKSISDTEDRVVLDGAQTSESLGAAVSGDGDGDREVAMDVDNEVEPSAVLGTEETEDVEMEGQDTMEGRESVSVGGTEGEERNTGEGRGTDREDHTDGDEAQGTTTAASGVVEDSTPENDLITWEKIWNFSYERMDRIGWKHAPITSTIMTGYTSPTNPLAELFSHGRVTVVREKYRPVKLVCLSVSWNTREIEN